MWSCKQIIDGWRCHQPTLRFARPESIRGAVEFTYQTHRPDQKQAGVLHTSEPHHIDELCGLFMAPGPHVWNPCFKFSLSDVNWAHCLTSLDLQFSLFFKSSVRGNVQGSFFEELLVLLCALSSSHHPLHKLETWNHSEDKDLHGKFFFF